MPQKRAGVMITTDNSRNRRDEIYSQLDDEQFKMLVKTVEEEKIVGLVLWEESIADEEKEKPALEARALFDLDLYLENNLFLELYGTFIFPDPDNDPLHGWQQTGKILQTLIANGVWLDEIAATEEDELILILSQNHKPQLYMNVGGWSIEEWETLPSEQ